VKYGGRGSPQFPGECSQSSASVLARHAGHRTARYSELANLIQEPLDSWFLVVKKDWLPAFPLQTSEKSHDDLFAPSKDGGIYKMHYYSVHYCQSTGTSD
jgi:hypothetical protein